MNKMLDRYGLRKGSASLLRAMSAILLAVLLSLGAQTLEDRYALRYDYSFNGVTTQGEESERVLDALTRKVHVYALFTPGQEDLALIGLLERFRARSDYFTFTIENLAENPGLAGKISNSLADVQVSNDSLIVYCIETDRARVLSGADYISQSFDTKMESYYISGVTYEKSLSEAIVFVSTQQLPILQVLNGHGELSQDETAALEELLIRYNYAFGRVDLQRGDPLDPTSPLLILSPVKDLSDDEVKTINAYCTAGGSLLITRDYDHSLRLPNFEALYRIYGFELRQGMVIAHEDAQGSYYESRAVLMPYMERTQPTLGMVAAGQTTLILAGCAAFQEPPEMNASLSTQIVLRSGNAYLRRLDDQAAGIEEQPGDQSGIFPLALLAERVFEDGTHSKAFIIGNSSVFTDSWLQGNTYSSEFLLNIVNYLDPGEPIQLAIAPKDAIRQPMRITSPSLINLLLWLPPATVLISGLVFLLKRKRL
jgi:ABC-2 type transport system permease protein